VESRRVLEKVDTSSKSTMFSNKLSDDKSTKFGIQKDTCIITVSGNSKTLGKVLNASNEVMSLLGYKKNELINQQVEIIMPNHYAEFHNTKMRQYFETGKSKIVNHDRVLFAQQRNGYLAEINLY
jgi:light-regulated signal transduction histidine kinase (bacteriophytochrome)